MSQSLAGKKRRNNAVSYLFLALFFTVFFALGSIAFWSIFLKPVLNVQKAKHWPTVPCSIISSEVKTHSSSDGNTYSIEIQFNYEYKGRVYTSRTYSFSAGSSSGYKSKRAVVDKYPQGRKTQCYVNPNNPSIAVLNRGITSSIRMGLFTLIFVLVGLGGWLFIIFSLLRKNRNKSLSSGAKSGLVQHGFGTLRSIGKSAQSFTPDKYLPDYDPNVGLVVLRPSRRRWGMLLGFVVMAVFWNGIVSIFLFHMIAGFRQGRPEWFLVFFLIPFELVGLFFIGMVIHRLLALSNPRPVLRLDSSTATPGDSLDLNWEITGNVRRIRNLKMQFIGMESCRYTVGTSTYTDQDIFYEQLLVDTDNSREMLTGSVLLKIPSNAMHSLKLNHNEIKWLLKVKGEIKRWPDIDDEFPLVVLPAGMKAEM